MSDPSGVQDAIKGLPERMTGTQAAIILRKYASEAANQVTLRAKLGLSFDEGMSTQAKQVNDAIAKLRQEANRYDKYPGVISRPSPEFSKVQLLVGLIFQQVYALKGRLAAVEQADRQFIQDVKDNVEKATNWGGGLAIVAAVAFGVVLAVKALRG